MLYFPGRGWHMKREKSLWTDCFAFPKTNSCCLPSGLNEPNPLGRGAGRRGDAPAACRSAFNRGRGKREASIQGILISFIQAGQHLEHFPSLLPGFEFM